MGTVTASSSDGACAVVIGDEAAADDAVADGRPVAWIHATAMRTEPLAYLAHAATLLGLVNNFPDTADRVMLFGHNPGLSTFCADLCENAPGELITCHTVRIDLFVDQWAHVSMGSGIVRWHDDPKRHPSG